MLTKLRLLMLGIRTRNRPLGRWEFERLYAMRSGLTVEETRALGLRPVTCRCPFEDCRGWQMIHRDSERMFMTQGAERELDAVERIIAEAR